MVNYKKRIEKKDETNGNDRPYRFFIYINYKNNIQYSYQTCIGLPCLYLVESLYLFNLEVEP